MGVFTDGQAMIGWGCGGKPPSGSRGIEPQG